MRYYYLLTGLQELSAEGHAPALEDLLEQMQQQMPASDWALVELLRRAPQTIELPEEEDEPSPLSEADRKTALYYEQGLHCRNRFVREWFAFNRDMNNILTAAICRKHGLDLSKAVIGEMPDEVMPEVQALSGVEDLYEREKRQDAIRWAWLEEHTLFRNFEVENVLAYYLQTVMLHRWDLLTKEEGERVFREMLADMKRDVKF